MNWDWLDYVIIAMWFSQMAVAIWTVRGHKKFKRGLEIREREFTASIGEFVKDMRGRDARSFMKWIDRKRYERLIGDQWINKETLQHVTLDEMIQQFVNETTVIEKS